MVHFDVYISIPHKVLKSDRSKIGNNTHVMTALVVTEMNLWLLSTSWAQDICDVQ